MRNIAVKKAIKIIFTVFLRSFVLEIIILSGIAFAHGSEKHGKGAIDDLQMKKLHAMMPIFSQESAKLENALEKGDVTSVNLHCDNILKELPDLKKCKPHKNLKERKRFAQLAANLEESVKTAARLAQEGDFAAGRSAFKKIEETCSACHAKFRD